MVEVEWYFYDVVVIGFGGVGLCVVIEVWECGLKVVVVCKFLFGKVYMVMVEGGCVVVMGNVNLKDNWKIYFGDMMCGGKFLNNWCMVELYVKEVLDWVWELEIYGVLFDCIDDG